MLLTSKFLFVGVNHARFQIMIFINGMANEKTILLFLTTARDENFVWEHILTV